MKKAIVFIFYTIVYKLHPNKFFYSKAQRHSLLKIFNQIFYKDKVKKKKKTNILILTSILKIFALYIIISVIDNNYRKLLEVSITV